MRIVSYCLMSNHWHFVLWPENEGDLGAFMQQLTITHARNWQGNRRRVGRRRPLRFRVAYAAKRRRMWQPSKGLAIFQIQPERS